MNIEWWDDRERWESVQKMIRENEDMYFSALEINVSLGAQWKLLLFMENNVELSYYEHQFRVCGIRDSEYDIQVTIT